MKRATAFSGRATPAILMLLITLGGCTESGVEPDEHQEPTGIAISINGTETVRQIGDSTASLGTLRVDSTSDRYSVIFVDDEGDTFEPHADEGFSLSVVVSDTNVVRLLDPLPTDPWSFQISGVRAGTTALRIELMHGGHSDFGSGDLTIEVVD